MQKFKLHQSSIVVGSASLLILTVIIVPGVDLHQFGYTNGIQWYMDPVIGGQFEHGWPIVFLERDTQSLNAHKPISGLPWLSVRAWDLSDGTPVAFSLAAICVDIASALAIAGGVLIAWELRRRRRRHSWQLTISEMLLMTMATAAVFGWLAYQRREAMRESPHVEAINAFDDGLDALNECKVNAPKWLVRFLGPHSLPEFLWRSSDIGIRTGLSGDYSSFADATPHLQELRQLNKVSISIVPPGVGVPYNELGKIKQVRRLEVDLVFEEDLENWFILPRELEQIQHLDELTLPTRQSLPQESADFLRTRMPRCRVIFADEER